MKQSLLLKTLVTYAIFFVLDRIYLNVMSEKIGKQIEKVQKRKIESNQLGIVFLNILTIIALYLFIIEPNANLFHAFFLGFLIQGSMNFTNMAVFTEWKSEITIIDTIVGGFQTLIAVYLARKLV